MTNQKSKSYNSILIMVDQLIKRVYYKLIKLNIIIFGLAKIIIKIKIQYYGFFNLVINN